MSNIVFGTLSSLQSLLFTSLDHLNLGDTVTNADISLTSNGLFTNLGVGGVNLSFPTLALSGASQDGHVMFSDGSLLTGTSLADTLTGSTGNDAEYGGDGNDHLAGGDGNDVIMGGGGGDTIEGGAGCDHMYGCGPNGGADGNDSMDGNGGNDYEQGNAGSDTLNGDEGSDRLVGGQDNDFLNGGVGNDQLNGNLGADHLDGGAGEDLVRGGKGDDVLLGGDGNDTLMGDLGADTMTGGAGADLFSFRSNDAASLSTDTLLGRIDTITDFTIGTDHISLGFTPAAVHDSSASTIASALIWATSALTGHGGDVATVEVGADTFLFYSTSGGAIADSVIDLQGVHNLTLASFV